MSTLSTPSSTSTVPTFKPRTVRFALPLAPDSPIPFLTQHSSHPQPPFTTNLELEKPEAAKPKQWTLFTHAVAYLTMLIGGVYALNARLAGLQCIAVVYFSLLAWV